MSTGPTSRKTSNGAREFSGTIKTVACGSNNGAPNCLARLLISRKNTSRAAASGSNQYAIAWTFSVIWPRAKAPVIPGRSREIRQRNLKDNLHGLPQFPLGDDKGGGAVIIFLCPQM